MRILPADTIVSVPLDVADRLFGAAQLIYPPTDVELCQPDVQATLRRQIRNADPDGFDALHAAITERVGRPPHVVVVRGVRFDTEHRLFTALVTTLGDAVDPYQTQWSQLVREIRPSTDRASDRWGVLNERLHTDGTDWEDPNTFTCLQCVRPDVNGGGRSRSLDVEWICEETERRLGGDALQRLAEPFPWALAEALGGGVSHQPVLNDDGIRWLRFTIEEAARRGPQLDRGTLQLVASFEELLAHTEATFDFSLSPGNLVVLDNRRCLHARTPIPDASTSSRLLLRMKLIRRKMAAKPEADA